MNPRTLLLMATYLILGCARKGNMKETEGIGNVAAGQIWTFKARSGEEGSRLTVLKTESHPKLGNVIHIALDGLRMKNPHAADGVSSTIGHMPYQEAALRASLVSVAGQSTATPNLDGYRTWKVAFDKGEAGIWSVQVSEAIAAMEKVAGQ